MTRFGVISKLGQTFKSHMQTFEGIFSFGPNFESSLAFFFKNFGQISMAIK